MILSNPIRNTLITIFLLVNLSLDLDAQKSPLSLFDALSNEPELPELVIKTDYKKLLKHRNKEEYQAASISVIVDSKPIIDNSKSRIRTRGNMRKEVCRIPPFKIDFEENDLIVLGFDSLDNLKLVLPCQNKSGPQERLFKEKLAYDLYNVLDSNAIKTFLVNVQFQFEGEIKENMVGFIVEDEKNYVRRKNGRLVEDGKIIARNLDRLSFLKMSFFQYMIANTDWAITERHNLEVVKLPGYNRPIALPYDFDYSGFVDQPYAVPHSSLPIRSVRERYFHPYMIKKGEFRAMMSFFESKEEDLYAICRNAHYMEEKTKEECEKFIASFYDLFDNKRWLNKYLKS